MNSEMAQCRVVMAPSASRLACHLWALSPPPRRSSAPPRGLSLPPAERFSWYLLACRHPLPYGELTLTLDKLLSFWVLVQISDERTGYRLLSTQSLIRTYTQTPFCLVLGPGPPQRIGSRASEVSSNLCHILHLQDIY